MKTGSLFLLEVGTRELFLGDGLLCLLRDFDKLGSNERLGAVMIPPKALYEAEGERMVFKLEKAPGQKQDASGYIAIRCRRASEYDLRFLNDYDKSESSDFLGLKKNVKTATDSLGGAGNIKSIITSNERTFRENGEKVKKVSPNIGPRQGRFNFSVYTPLSPLTVEDH